MDEYTGTFEMVDPKLIVVDHRYQRKEKQNLIMQIARDPRWEAFGVPTLFKRDNEVYYAADGQQRIRGVMMSNDPPKLIPAVWFPMEKLEDEADVFVKINEWRKQLMPMEKHKSKVQSKDPAALAIERAVELAGFSVGHTRGARGEDPKTIAAIGSVGVIYNQLGEEGLVRVLTLIKTSWPDDANGLGTHVLRGVANLVEEQGDNYDRAKLVKGLQKTSPAALIRKADELRYMHGGSKIANMRKSIKALAKV